MLWPLLQRKLDVLNKAGLSKDNFHDSDARSAKCQKRTAENSRSGAMNDSAEDDADGGGPSPSSSSSPSKNKKITDFFSTSITEQDLEEWGVCVNICLL